MSIITPLRYSSDQRTPISLILSRHIYYKVDEWSIHNYGYLTCYGRNGYLLDLHEINPSLRLIRDILLIYMYACSVLIFLLGFTWDLTMLTGRAHKNCTKVIYRSRKE